MYFGVVVSVLAAGGCAGREPAPREPSHADFEAIQRAEARVAEGHAAARRALAQPDGDCPAACRAAGETCDASEEVCGIAKGLDDADAQHRCRRARATCRESRTRVDAQCTCDEAAP